MKKDQLHEAMIQELIERDPTAGPFFRAIFGTTEDGEPYQQAYNEMINKILPEVIEQMKLANQDYRGAFLMLGAKGQISEIVRKMFKLYFSVWQGHELQREQPEQIAKELIPHCLMLIWCLQKGIEG